MALSFLLPLGLWCAVSYVPWLWHPQMRVLDPGGSTMLQKDMLIDREPFAEENAKLATEGKPLAVGKRSNPIFLPAPHQVATSLVTAYTTPPRKGDKWLHEAMWGSMQVIFWGFILSTAIGVPLGILCGTYNLFSRILEPFTDFIRYMPAPAFGALMIALFGLYDAPKIAIIFIGTFFQMVLVIANTTRLLDKGLLEAAQTLGASDRQLLTRVVLPGVLPGIYNDLRILLGLAWTYLIVAELIGASSGISYFINQQGKYRNYPNVFAGIVTIGFIGLVCDQIFAWLGRILFPYHGTPPSRLSVAVWRTITWPVTLPWRLLRLARTHHPAAQTARLAGERE